MKRNDPSCFILSPFVCFCFVIFSGVAVLSTVKQLMEIILIHSKYFSVSEWLKSPGYR